MPTRHHTCTTWREVAPIVVAEEAFDPPIPITISAPARARTIAEAHDHQMINAAHQATTSTALGP